MGGKKPVEKNREWEKGRRDKLNNKFTELSRLLPDHDPSITLSKMEILNKAAEYIKTLQQQNRDILNGGKETYLDAEVCKLEQRVTHLVFKTKLLVDALRNAGVPIPEVKPPRKRKRPNKQNEASKETSSPDLLNDGKVKGRKKGLSVEENGLPEALKPLHTTYCNSPCKDSDNSIKSSEESLLKTKDSNELTKKVEETFKRPKESVKISKEPLKEINSTLPSVNIPKDISSVSQAPQVSIASTAVKEQPILTSTIPGVITSIAQNTSIPNFSLFDRTSLVNLGPGTLILSDGRVVNVPPPLPQIVVKPQPTLILMQKTVKKEKRLYPKQVDITRTTYTNKAPIPAIKHFEFKNKRKIKVVKTTRLSHKQIKRKETVKSKIITKSNLVKINDSLIQKDDPAIIIGESVSRSCDIISVETIQSSSTGEIKQKHATSLKDNLIGANKELSPTSDPNLVESAPNVNNVDSELEKSNETQHEDHSVLNVLSADTPTEKCSDSIINFNDIKTTESSNIDNVNSQSLISLDIEINQNPIDNNSCGNTKNIIDSKLLQEVNIVQSTQVSLDKSTENTDKVINSGLNISKNELDNSCSIINDSLDNALNINTKGFKSGQNEGDTANQPDSMTRVVSPVFKVANNLKSKELDNNQITSSSICNKNDLSLKLNNCQNNISADSNDPTPVIDKTLLNDGVMMTQSNKPNSEQECTLSDHSLNDMNSNYQRSIEETHSLNNASQLSKGKQNKSIMENVNRHLPLNSKPIIREQAQLQEVNLNNLSFKNDSRLIKPDSQYTHQNCIPRTDPMVRNQKEGTHSTFTNSTTGLLDIGRVQNDNTTSVLEQNSSQENLRVQERKLVETFNNHKNKETLSERTCSMNRKLSTENQRPTLPEKKFESQTNFISNRESIQVTQFSSQSTSTKGTSTDKCRESFNTQTNSLVNSYRQVNSDKKCPPSLSNKSENESINKYTVQQTPTAEMFQSCNFGQEPLKNQKISPNKETFFFNPQNGLNQNLFLDKNGPLMRNGMSNQSSLLNSCSYSNSALYSNLSHNSVMPKESYSTSSKSLTKTPYSNTNQNKSLIHAYPNQGGSLMNKDCTNRNSSSNKTGYANHSNNLPNEFTGRNGSLNKEYVSGTSSINKESIDQSRPVNEDYANQCNTLNKEYANQNSSLNKDYTNQSKTLSKEYTNQNSSFNKEYCSQNNALNKEFINQNNTLNKDYGDCSNSLNKEYVNHNNQLSREFGSQNNTLNKEYGNRGNSLNRDYGNRNNALNKEFANQNNSLNKEFTNQNTPLNKEFGNQINTLNKEYSNQNISLNKEFINQNNSLNKDYINQNPTYTNNKDSSFSTLNESINKTSFGNHSGSLVNRNISVTKDFANQTNSLNKEFTNRINSLNDDYTNQNASLIKDFGNQTASLNKDYSNQADSLNKEYANKSSTVSKDFSQSDSINKNSYSHQNSSLCVSSAMNKNSFNANKDAYGQSDAVNKKNSFSGQNTSLNKDMFTNQNETLISKSSFTNHSQSLSKDSYSTSQDNAIVSGSYLSHNKSVSKEMYAGQTGSFNKQAYSKQNSGLNKQSYRSVECSSNDKVCHPEMPVCRSLANSEFMEVVNQNIRDQHNNGQEMPALQMIEKDKQRIANNEERNLNCSLNSSGMFSNQASFPSVSVHLNGSVNVSEGNDENISYDGSIQKRNSSNKDNSDFNNKNNGGGIVCKYTIDSLFKNANINSHVTIGTESNNKNISDNGRTTTCKNALEKRNSAPYELDSLPIVSDTNLNHGQNQMYQNDSAAYSITSRETGNICGTIIDSNMRGEVSGSNNRMIQSDLNNSKSNQTDKTGQNKMYTATSSTNESNNYNKNDSILISSNDLMKSKELDRNNLMPLLDDVRLTTDFSSDLFSSFQVAPGGQHPESMSPTAAFLLAFPLVSTSKTADNINENDNPEHNSSTPTTILQIGNIDSSNPDLFHSQVDSLRPSKPDDPNKDFERYANYEPNMYDQVPTQIDVSKRKATQNQIFPEQSATCSDKSYKRCDSRKRQRNQQADPLPSYSQSYAYPIFPNNNDFSQFPTGNVSEPKSNPEISAPWTMNLNQDFGTHANQPVVQQKDVCTSTTVPPKSMKERKSSKNDKQQSLKNSNFSCSQQSSQTVEYYSLKSDRKKQKTSHSKTPVNWMAPLESTSGKNTVVEPQLSQVEMYPSSKEHDTANLLTSVNQSQNVYNNIVSSLEVPFDTVCFTDFSNKKSNNYSWSPNKSLLPSLDSHNFVIPSTLPTLVGDLALGTSTPAETFKPFEERRYEPPKKADKSSSTYLDNTISSSSNPKKRSDYNNKGVNNNNNNNSFLSVSQLVDPKNQQKQSKMNDINSRKRNDNTNKHQNILSTSAIRREQDPNCLYNQRNEVSANCWGEKQQQKNQYKGNYSAESLIGGVPAAPDATETFHLNFNNYQTQNNYFHTDFTDNQLQQGQNYQNYFNAQSTPHFPTFIGEEFPHNVHEFQATSSSSGSQRKKKQKDNNAPIYSTSINPKPQDAFGTLHKEPNLYLNNLPKESASYQAAGLLSQSYPNCIKTSVPYVTQHTNTTSTLTNFNLSTIFPEMNDQRVGATATSHSSHLNPNFSTLPLHNYPSH